jgi:putative Holliday junction resolvase
MIATDPRDFADALPDGGRLMALDLGTKTIGVAFCDAGWSFASPDKTIVRTKFAKEKAQLADLVARQAIVGIVIGLPLNMDGSESPRSQSARAFARNLADLGLPILLRDERWSTQAVERSMVASDVSRGKRAARIDAAAAAYILQGAIDALTAL